MSDFKYKIIYQVGHLFTIRTKYRSVIYMRVWLKVDDIVREIFENFNYRDISCTFYDQRTNN